MNKQKVVSYKNLPAKLPLQLTLIVWLFLDRLEASAVVQAVSYTLLAIVWIGAIIRLSNEKQFGIDAILKD